MSLRVTARPGLQSGQFRSPPLHVREGAWSDVDLAEPGMRAAVLAYAQSHLRIAVGQDRELEKFDILVMNERLRAELVHIFSLQPAELKAIEKTPNGALFDLHTWGPKAQAAREQRELADRDAEQARAAAERAEFAASMASEAAAKSERDRAEAIAAKEATERAAAQAADERARIENAAAAASESASDAAEFANAAEVAAKKAAKK